MIEFTFTESNFVALVKGAEYVLQAHLQGQAVELTTNGIVVENDGEEFKIKVEEE